MITSAAPSSKRWTELRPPLNGTDVTESSTPSAVPTSIMLGYGPNNEAAAADVAEVIVYDGTVSDTEWTAIEGYLNGKWGT